jgi:hypothetical protein
MKTMLNQQHDTYVADTSRTHTDDSEQSQPAQQTSNSSVLFPVIDVEEELWLDQFSRYLGFGLISDKTSSNLPPSYIYAVLTVLGWTVVSVSADLFIFNESPIYVTNPYFLLQPVVLLGGVYGAHSLRRSYNRAINEMAISQRANDPERFFNITPRRIPTVLFALVAGLQLVRFAADFSSFSTTGIVANGLIFPFVYAPILVQFLVVYIGIEFVAPWKLYNSNIGIHFLDPHGVGGLRPIGELVKKAYYYVVAGLVVYALITYAPGVSGWDASVTAGTIFTIAWLATITTVAFAVYILHRFLHREKREELQQLELMLRQRMENPWSIQEYQPKEGKENEVDDLRQRINEVSATREYPATFSIWTQLLLSIVIPKALQLFLTST